METIPGPVLIVPRLDPKPWGSDRLARHGINLQGQTQIGEAVLTTNDVQIASGPHLGSTLGELIATNPEGLLGPMGMQLCGHRMQIPILVKLLDATENLSIQVHPDNASAPERSLGKTEAWYVLEANPDAVVYAGLRETATFDELSSKLLVGESIEPLINRLKVSAGDVIYLPAGTIHALGGGIVVYEIQQQSDITYRLHDWGRERELHIDASLAAIKSESRPMPSRPMIGTGEQRMTAVRCEYFALDIIQIGPGEQLDLPPESAPQILTGVSGSAEVSSSRGDVDLKLGATAILFAHVGPVRLSSLVGARILRGWLG